MVRNMGYHRILLGYSPSYRAVRVSYYGVPVYIIRFPSDQLEKSAGHRGILERQADG